MAATLDATVGGSAANSYNTALELDAVALELYPAPTAWAGIDTDARTRAAIAATRVLDLERFPEDRVNETQALEWPRDGVLKGFGLWGCWPITVIPTPVKTAHARLTFFLAEQVVAGVDPFAPNPDAGLSSMNLGYEIHMVFEKHATSVTAGAQFMATVVRPLLAQHGLVYASQPRIVRG